MGILDTDGKVSPLLEAGSEPLPPKPKTPPVSIKAKVVDVDALAARLAREQRLQQQQSAREIGRRARTQPPVVLGGRKIRRFLGEFEAGSARFEGYAPSSVAQTAQFGVAAQGALAAVGYAPISLKAGALLSQIPAGAIVAASATPPGSFTGDQPPDPPPDPQGCPSSPVIDTFAVPDGTELRTLPMWSFLAGEPTAAITLSGGVKINHNTRSAFIVCDQASADHYTQARLATLTSFSGNYIAARLVDQNNCIGIVLTGVGTIGLRLRKMVAGVVTDLGPQTQGAANQWVRVECSGTTVRMFTGGTGATPTWVQLGTDVTVTDFSTETSQGLVTDGINANPWIFDFEAGSLCCP